MRKRPVLLLELTISMVLMAAIVGILFASYREVSVVKADLKKEKEFVFNRQRLQLRLLQIFSHLNVVKPIDPQHLFFSYDNGPDLDSAFRGAVEGMLFIDRGKLYLATWPEKGNPRLEALYENVSKLELEIFDSEKGQWSPDYPTTKPFMMKLSLDKNMEIPFFL
jgi:hypothetical protein